MIFRVQDKGAYILRFSVHLDATEGSVESGHACVFEVHMVDVHNRLQASSLVQRFARMQRVSLEATNPKLKPWRKAGRAPHATPAMDY